MAIWNNQTVSGVGHEAKETLSGFKAFILRGNVVDLAVGIMIGAAFTAVVNGLVEQRYNTSYTTSYWQSGNLDMAPSL